MIRIRIENLAWDVMIVCQKCGPSLIKPKMVRVGSPCCFFFFQLVKKKPQIGKIVYCFFLKKNLKSNLEWVYNVGVFFLLPLAQRECPQKLVVERVEGKERVPKPRSPSQLEQRAARRAKGRLFEPGPSTSSRC